MFELVKSRIITLLGMIDPSKISCDKPLLEQYEDALSVNKKGYSIHYQRDVNEIMVNTYNP